MPEPDYLTRAGRLSELCTRLFYGPGTWFEACREAAAGEAAGASDLLARLEPGHEVAEALAIRRSWPGQSRLRRAAPGDRADPGGPTTEAALSAARAAAEVVAVLGGMADPEARLRTAINHGLRANVLPHVSISGADIGFDPAESPLGALGRRLAVIADNMTPEDAAAAGLVALLACALRDAVPAAVREVELPVLFDRRSAGSHGFLRIACLRGGPRGLYPDPRAMLFLVADRPFGETLDTAWRTAPPRLANRCVLWGLTEDGQPCDEVMGGSLGGAFAVGLAELSAAVPGLGQLRPRRLDRRCV